MGADEKLMVDSLVSISRSLNKISDDLGKIVDMMGYEHRAHLRESRRRRASENSVLTESQRATTPKFGDSREDMLSAIRMIRGESK